MTYSLLVMSKSKNINKLSDDYNELKEELVSKYRKISIYINGT